MAQQVRRRNADFIKYGDSSTGPDSTRDKRVDDMGAAAKIRAENKWALNRVDPNVELKANKPVNAKVSPAQAAKAMSGKSYSKLLKVK